MVLATRCQRRKDGDARNGASGKTSAPRAALNSRRDAPGSGFGLMPKALLGRTSHMAWTRFVQMRLPSKQQPERFPSSVHILDRE